MANMMRCLDREFTDNGVYLYRVQTADLTGKIEAHTEFRIRQMITNEGVTFTNLRVDSKGRIIMLKGGKTELEEEMERLIGKSTLLNRVTKLQGAWDQNIIGYVISLTPTRHIYYIPPEQNGAIGMPAYIHSGSVSQITSLVAGLRGYIEVVGGWNIIDTSYMFVDCDCDVIDLTRFYAKRTETMIKMFYNCKAKEVKMGDFTGQHALNLQSMFMMSDIESLDLSGFRTRKDANYADIFKDSTTKFLDLSGFILDDVLQMTSVVTSCVNKHIKLNKDYKKTLDVMIPRLVERTKSAKLLMKQQYSEKELVDKVFDLDNLIIDWV